MKAQCTDGFMQTYHLGVAELSLAVDDKGWPHEGGKQPCDAHSVTCNRHMLSDISRTSAVGQALSSSRKSGDCCTQL